MKILISPVTSVPVSEHAINDLRRAGAQFRVQRVDHKIAFIAPITWAGMSDTKWVLSALINDDEKTVLLRACLLYTSPSPRDRQKSRMPSSA